MQFLLKEGCGGHRVGLGDDAVDYVPGDIVESDDDLTEKFPNKFMLLADDDGELEDVQDNGGNDE
ncbi:MAG: hypothetical protein Tsb009_29970 [Planctomycetaceae bacterium]